MTDHRQRRCEHVLGDVGDPPGNLGQPDDTHGGQLAVSGFVASDQRLQSDDASGDTRQLRLVVHRDPAFVERATHRGVARRR